MRSDFAIINVLNKLKIEKEKHVEELNKLDLTIKTLQQFVSTHEQTNNYETYQKGRFSYSQFMDLPKEIRYQEVVNSFNRTCKDGSSSRKEIILDLFGEYKVGSTQYQCVLSLITHLEFVEKVFYTDGRRLHSCENT